MFSLNVFSSFEDASKGFVIIESSTGGKYLAVAVKMTDGEYIITSQSVFLYGIPKFRLKTFTGKSLKQTGFEVDRKSDMVRIKYEKSPDITPLEPAPNASGKKDVFSMDSATGIVYMSNARGGNLVNKGFNCSAGAPVINQNSQFVGVASRTDDGFGRRIEMKVAPISETPKWSSIKPFSFTKQVYSLHKLIEFTKALNYTRDHCGKKRLIEINEKTHPKLMGWAKNQNQQAWNIMLSRKTKASLGKAMREHQARCFHYSSLKRLSAYYSSNAQLAKKGRWRSLYLKGRAKSIYENNNASAKELKASMKSMVSIHPSIKAKM